VRVSSGHLCEAEAPTEPTGETAALCTPFHVSARLNFICKKLGYLKIQIPFLFWFDCGDKLSYYL